MSIYSLEKLESFRGGLKQTVFVGMSGGVDSSVAAFLLKKQGYDVVGVFMRCYNLDGCAERDAEDARRVAERIGIPFYVWDFEEAYKKRVVEYMIDGYRAGITPNPDVMCNREIKFGLFLEKALAAGADYVATGHYVSIKPHSSPLSSSRRRGPVLPVFSLHSAKDKTKDQSYFLWTLTSENLKHCLFPIGGYLKTEVRAIAKKAGLSTAEKKDSQGVCFLGDISVQDFLKQYIPSKKGSLVTTTGDVIGEHEGAEFYTIGQRHLGIPYRRSPASGSKDTAPFYVASKDITTNTVTVAEGSENEALYRNEVSLANLNFLSSYDAPAGKGVEVFARVRYRQPLTKATLFVVKKGAKTSARLVFEKPQKFIAPGQSAVWYAKSGEMLGGGVIV